MYYSPFPAFPFFILSYFFIFLPHFDCGGVGFGFARFFVWCYRGGFLGGVFCVVGVGGCWGRPSQRLNSPVHFSPLVFPTPFRFFFFIVSCPRPLFVVSLTRSGGDAFRPCSADLFRSVYRISYGPRELTGFFCPSTCGTQAFRRFFFCPFRCAFPFFLAFPATCLIFFLFVFPIASPPPTPRFRSSLGLVLSHL